MNTNEEVKQALDNLNELIQETTADIDYDIDEDEALAPLTLKEIRELVAIITSLQSDNKRLRDVVEGINGWKDSCEMYANAWARELGGTYPKTHLIDALVVTTRAMKKKLNAFEEVSKKDFR